MKGDLNEKEENKLENNSDLIDQIDPNKEAEISDALFKVSAIGFACLLDVLASLLHVAINYIFISKEYNDINMINGLGIAALLLGCLYYPLLYGLPSGIENFCGNAVGAKKYKLAGYYFYRGIIINISVIIVISIILIVGTKPALKAIGFNEEVIYYCYRYIWIYLCTSIFECLYAIAGRAMGVIEMNYLNIIATLLSLAVHIGFNFLLVKHLRLDTFGSGLSISICNVLLGIGMLILLWKMNPYKEANFMINKHCFKLKPLWSYFKFSILTGYIETAAYLSDTIIVILTLWIIRKLENEFEINETESVFFICMQILNILYSPTFGFAPALSIVICKIVPLFPVKEIKKVTIICTLFSFGITLIICIFGIIFRQPLFNIFTINENLRIRSKSILLFTVLAALLYSAKFILIILKSLGKDLLGFIMLLLNMIILSPLSIIICGYVLKLSTKGVFLGVAIAHGLSGLVYVFTLFFIDFEKCQIEVRENLIKESKLLKEFGKEDEEEESILKNDSNVSLTGFENIEEERIPLKTKSE